MVTISTATPEQIANCVLVLKGHIDRVEADSRAKDAEIKRLRLVIERGGETLERLEAENGRLRDALRPFAELNQTMLRDKTVSRSVWVPYWNDLMRADEALKGSGHAG